jgi:hypothetical protein
MITFENQTSHPDTDFALFRDACATHTTLERALPWFFSQSPPLHPADMIQQDEYSYDLLVPLTSPFYLTYSCC